jgi:hypothetical protein
VGQAIAGSRGDLPKVSLYPLGLLKHIRGSMQDQDIPIPFGHTMLTSPAQNLQIR